MKAYSNTKGAPFKFPLNKISAGQGFAYSSVWVGGGEDGGAGKGGGDMHAVNWHYRDLGQCREVSSDFAAMSQRRLTHMLYKGSVCTK